MARMLWITTLSIALASTAGVVKASAANPLEVARRHRFEPRTESARRSCLLRLRGIANHRDRAASGRH